MNIQEDQSFNDFLDLVYKMKPNSIKLAGAAIAKFLEGFEKLHQEESHDACPCVMKAFEMMLHGFKMTLEIKEDHFAESERRN